MQYIAGAIVILAGSLLWGMAALAMSWVYDAGGNRGIAVMGCWGGFAVICFGVAVLLAAFYQENEARRRPPA
jgi:hypothetical protein